MLIGFTALVQLSVVPGSRHNDIARSVLGQTTAVSIKHNSKGANFASFGGVTSH